jgi:tetratricopeptide (TPR) repeat protein
MNLRLLAACAALVVVAGPAAADPPAAAKAGLEALSKGDNDAAIRLLSEALLYGRLARSDRELVYEKRAEALLAAGHSDDALADAQRALALNPADGDAADIVEKARPTVQPVASATTPATGVLVAPVDPSVGLNAKVKADLDGVQARNTAAAAKYEAEMAAYETEKAAVEAERKANDEAYAASLAAHQAEVEALARKQAADIADWQRRVQACQHGDRAQCASETTASAAPAK